MSLSHESHDLEGGLDPGKYQTASNDRKGKIEKTKEDKITRTPLPFKRKG
jgi:hypothetical protein